MSFQRGDNFVMDEDSFVRRGLAGIFASSGDDFSFSVNREWGVA
jgi:hypothetical protein